MTRRRPISLFTVLALTACADQMVEVPKCAYTLLETIDPDSTEGQEHVQAHWAELEALTQVKLVRDDHTVAFQDAFHWNVSDIVIERREYNDPRTTCPDSEVVVRLDASVHLQSDQGLDVHQFAERTVSPERTWHRVHDGYGSETVSATAPPSYAAESCIMEPDISDRVFFSMGYPYPKVVDGSGPHISMAGKSQACWALDVVPRVPTN